MCGDLPPVFSAGCLLYLYLVYTVFALYWSILWLVSWCLPLFVVMLPILCLFLQFVMVKYWFHIFIVYICAIFISRYTICYWPWSLYIYINGEGESWLWGEDAWYEAYNNTVGWLFAVSCSVRCTTKYMHPVSLCLQISLFHWHVDEPGATQIASVVILSVLMSLIVPYCYFTYSYDLGRVHPQFLLNMFIISWCWYENVWFCTRVQKWT